MRFRTVVATPWRAKEDIRIRIVMGMRRVVFALALFGAACLLSPAPVQASQVSPGDACLSLLSSGSSKASPEKEIQRSAGVTPAAGKAATLSLLLGVRVALGPSEDLKTGDETAKSGERDVTALDIASYRACKKQQALMLSSL